jgi:hypothetical protein
MGAVMRIGVLACSALFGLTSFVAHGAEYALSDYGLGGFAFEAGVTPPPGWYVTPYAGLYEGKISGELDFGGTLLNVGAKLDFFQTGVNVLYAPDTKILGGQFAFSVDVPTGYVNVDASAAAGAFAGTRSVSGWGFGDMSARAQLGWTIGQFSDTLALTGYAPTGKYETGFEPITGLNRPAVDATWAFTWLEKNTNLDFSGAVGVTFNAPNIQTNYKTGDEAHFEWAIGEKFSNGVEIGPVGYFYDQLTGDSGSGAFLGPFKGLVTGIGPGIGYTTLIDKTVLILNARYYDEFDAERRFLGSTSLVSATIRF